MADALQLIIRRKTSFEFSERKVPASDMKKLLEAGRWAPSSHNSQPWRFIVVADRKKIEKLMELSYYGFFHSLPSAIIVAVLLPPEKIMPGMFRGDNARMAHYHKYIDIGQTVLAMSLEAESLGISSCILSLQLKGANRLLGAPHKSEAILALGIGYEKEGAYRNKRSRLPLSSLVSYEKFGKRVRK